jgi:hypothetical protein
VDPLDEPLELLELLELLLEVFGATVIAGNCPVVELNEFLPVPKKLNPSDCARERSI